MSPQKARDVRVPRAPCSVDSSALVTKHMRTHQQAGFFKTPSGYGRFSPHSTLKESV